MKSGSRVLVAGGCGFVGVNLIRRLLKTDVTLRATFHSKQPILVDDRVEYVRADLTDSEDCRRVVEGIDYVFMCAASTSGAASIASTPLVHVTTNVVMNSRILEASFLAGVRKFVWISSSVGYPPSGDRPVKEEQFFQGNPPDVYFASGWVKRYTETLGRLYSEKLERRMPVVVLRPSNLYGPYDKFEPLTSHVTAALIRKVVERQSPIVVWGDGKDVRDVLYIDDFIDALCLAAEKVDHFDPINVAAGEGHSVDEILRLLLEIEGYEGAKIVHDTTAPSMIPIRLIDSSRAKRVLGFRPKTPLKEGLEKTVRWYKQARRKGR